LKTLSVGEIEDAMEGAFWSAVLYEIRERDKYIMDLLREGKDPLWSDDNMRGRMNELDYVCHIPDILIEALKLEKPNNEKEGE
jgi:hypothetical protein